MRQSMTKTMTILTVLIAALSSFASLSGTLPMRPEIKSAVHTSLQPPLAASPVHVNGKHAALLEKLREHARECGIAQPQKKAFAVKGHAASDALKKLQSFDMPQVYDPAQKVVLHAPKRKSTYEVGDTMQVIWQASKKIHQVYVELSLDGGKTWMPLGRQASNGRRKSFRWVVPQLVGKQVTVSESCLLRVRSADFLHKATMTNNFEIKPQQRAAVN